MAGEVAISKISGARWWASFFVFLLPGLSAYAQDSNNNQVEEVTVVGSQIKGARISDALPASVITREDIDFLGVDSGDELLLAIPEQGQNFFNEADNINTGVNGARGDVGAFNIRNVGTGNTLVLMNGRRLVNSATFQDERVGGSPVPVNSVNSNSIPVGSLSRLEVLRDGASAIYGADAVAGVVNTVISNDFEGFNVKVKRKSYDGIPRNDSKVNLEFGRAFNDGQSHVVVYAEHYQRGRINSQDRERWSVSDFRNRIPADSPFAGNTRFRRDSISSQYGRYQFEETDRGMVPATLVDGSGRFVLRPLGDGGCEYTINNSVCGDRGTGAVRYNWNTDRDLVSDLERNNIYVGLTHVFDNDIEAYTELSGYFSDTNLKYHPTSIFGNTSLVVSKDNYYNPFGARMLNGAVNPNRLDDSVIGTGVPDEGLDVTINNHRFTEVPRIVDNDGETYRVVTGLRGEYKDWDWDTGIVWSRAEKDDVSHNRISNTLIQAALDLSTPDAYNPFNGAVDSNIAQALVDVYRRSEAELFSFDIKASNNELYELPWSNSGRSIGALLGAEFRRESYEDDRDPRLDGTIRFTARSEADADNNDVQPNEPPLLSDVANSSPTPDSSGSRNTISVFGELQIPIFDNLDLQLALRHENFSDIKNATVGKAAVGYRPFEAVLFRGSYSQTFRAPNLVTVNASSTARRVTIDDPVCAAANMRATENVVDQAEIERINGLFNCDPDGQRFTQGNRDLVPEESDNFSFGAVITPTENLTVTVDFWSIEKDNTIGLFGEDNHAALDLLRRLEHGAADCSNVASNSAVERDDDTLPTDPAVLAGYTAAGLCPAGTAERVNDRYINLDERKTRGIDFGLYYDLDTDFGEFGFKYNGAVLKRFSQKASGQASELLQAREAGTISAAVDIDGFQDLVGRDGNQRYKHNMIFSWRLEKVTSSISWYHIGSFNHTRIALSTGQFWKVERYNTFNASMRYSTQIQDIGLALGISVNNLFDKAPPLTSDFFGFSPDNHLNFGRSVSFDLSARF